MVPFSHILWSACWLGIATDAVARAARLRACRGAREARHGAADGAVRLAEVSTMLQTMRTNVHDVASECETLMTAPAAGPTPLSSIGFALKMNNLKVVVVRRPVVQIVHRALLICGIIGYKNDGQVQRSAVTCATRTPRR